jgi:hypothetical protein
MFKLLEVLFLVSRGVPLVRAWRKGMRRLNIFDYMLAGMAALWGMYVCVFYMVSTARAELSTHALRAVVAQQQVKQAHSMVDKYERMLLSCLNKEDILVDGVNRPCTVGDYK